VLVQRHKIEMATIAAGIATNVLSMAERELSMRTASAGANCDRCLHNRDDALEITGDSTGQA
jgi:hypothetical protein